MPDDGAFADAVRARMKGGYTTGQRVAQLESSGMTSMQAEMEQAGVAFPPQRLLLVVFKDARKLQIFGPTSKGWALACTMPILGASGGPGPKLREGDLQVPEGLYQIESLNPNSAHHLALRLNYPNPFDRHCAQLDGRTQLGGDIMIHGGSQSIGCLAVGDPAIERLFALSHLVGIANINVLIVPCDLRRCEPSASDMSPSWLDDLYSKLRQELAKLPTSEP
jgi:murein L,D-transpeptidase YafK